MIKEFKEFIMQGNVLDLAIAVVMGSAFTAIVNSLVEDIIGPIIAALSGSADVSDVTVAVGPAQLGVGSFLQAVIDFLIIALILFAIIKAINTMTNRFKRDEVLPEEVEAPTVEELLADIKDILKDDKAVNTTDGTINTTSLEDPDRTV